MVSDISYAILVLLQLPGIGRRTLSTNLSLIAAEPFQYSNAYEWVSSILPTINTRREYHRADIELAVHSADSIIQHCGKLNINIVSPYDDTFPPKLKIIDDSPVLLYSLGKIEQLSENSTLAIIGTRQPSDLGKRIANRVGILAASAGIITISGLAVGCDTEGHAGTIAGSGKTIAVLATGLNSIYPSENAYLAEEIINTGGCLISEYPPYSVVRKGNFVERDRLQAGLSDGVFVAETGIKGGSMHTVQYAEKYNRRVFCFNHPDSLQSSKEAQGNQLLIKNNRAIPVFDRNSVEQMIEYIKTCKFEDRSCCLPQHHSAMDHNSLGISKHNATKEKQISIWELEE